MMLPPTSCEAEAVSWTAMMGTIRSMRFFGMVTSRNVSWRVRGLEARLVGMVIAVSITAMLSRTGKDARSVVGRWGAKRKKPGGLG